MRAAIECSAELNEVVRDATSASDAVLAKKIRSRVARIMGRLLTQIMNPIGSEHPDLYPEALRPAPKSKKGPKNERPSQLPSSRRKRSTS